MLICKMNYDFPCTLDNWSVSLADTKEDNVCYKQRMFHTLSDYNRGRRKERKQATKKLK